MINYGIIEIAKNVVMFRRDAINAGEVTKANGYGSQIDSICEENQDVDGKSLCVDKSNDIVYWKKK
ncbi:MAG: hypothetical protein V1818_01815 [Candidatus Aenigmatarchaeota archaeon]